MVSDQPIRTGKVKDVFDRGDTLLFRFSDRISVFDKIIPTLVKDKGLSLCRISSFWFKTLKERSISTHFIESRGSEMTVKKFAVMERVNAAVYGNYLVPLEFVVRYYVAGSLFDKVKSGRISFTDLGFKNMPAYGEKLPDPFLEVTTKFEKFDRFLSIGEASSISGLHRYEIISILEECMKIDRIIEKQIENSGLIHADGKKEFALDRERSPVVVDTFGTPDEDRFWEKNEYENGNVVELSKEFVRQYYRNTGYHSKLYESREKNLKEPEIQPLPDEIAARVSELYRKMYERITGQKW
ncbi:MAG: phosphoribosylaminoimidazolesuccinocarboxamide synthase [Candidatus Thermoplasmatota archaeon]|nr:phosphoribosylaminoimidazolesuccinocarboxamide synthase [Candidatus Thermoplasmatota archaeon]